jgi:hypothetical protein
MKCDLNTKDTKNTKSILCNLKGIIALALNRYDDNYNNPGIGLNSIYLRALSVLRG